MESAAIWRLCVRKMSRSPTKTEDRAGNSPAISSIMLCNGYVNLNLSVCCPLTSSRSRSLHFSTSSLVMGSLLERRFQASFTLCQLDRLAMALFMVMLMGRSPS